MEAYKFVLENFWKYAFKSVNFGAFGRQDPKPPNLCLATSLLTNLLFLYHYPFTGEVP